MTAPVQLRFAKPLEQPSATTEPGGLRFARPVTVEVGGVPITDQQVTEHVADRVREAGFSAIELGGGGDLLETGKNILRFAGGIAAEIGRDLAAIGRVFPSVAVSPGGAGPQTAELIAQTKRELAQLTDEEREELEQRAMHGVALLGVVALDVSLLAVKIAARPLIAQLGRGAAVGGLYGILTKEDGESIVDAIAKDAALFAGVNLGFGLAFGGPLTAATERQLFDQAAMAQLKKLRPANEVRAAAAEQAAEMPASAKALKQFRDLLPTKRVALGSTDRTATLALEETRQAARRVTEEFFAAPRVGRMWIKATSEGVSASGATAREALDNLGQRTGAYTESGISRAIDILRNESGVVRGLGPPGVPADLVGRITTVSNPRDLWWYGKWLAPIHTWSKRNPVAGAIYNDARTRRVVQEEVVAEWRDLLTRTKKELPKKSDRIELGQLLDSHIRGEDLPAGTPEKLANIFAQWRARLTTDRKALQELLDLPPDWGIDAYFMHVFVGDWKVVNAATGEVVEAAGKAGFRRSFREAVEFSEGALRSNPALDIRIEPNQFTWETDAAIELGGRAYWNFIRRAQEALGLNKSEIQELTRGLTKPKGGVKFFGNIQARERELAGFLDDPLEAAAIYSHGLARKLAFHDFEKKSLQALEQAGLKAGGQPVLHDAIGDYIGRVLGRPGPLEKSWDSMVKYAFGPEGALGSLPIRPEQLRLGRIATNIRKLEGWARLGYSGSSSFVNLTQTVVNTASIIGYKDTLAATTLLSKASPIGKRVTPALAGQIDDLLIEMGVEYAVPLSAMGAAAKDMHKLAWWHPLYLFNKAETINRSVASLGGYMQALRTGQGRSAQLAKEGKWAEAIKAARVDGTHDAAVIAGRKLSDRTQFVYSVEDLPALLAGPAGQVLGQFKPFLVNELQFISELRGAEIARFLTSLTAMGGVGALMSLPFLNIGDVLVGEVTGERVSERIKRKLPRIGRGIFGALGFDAEQSLALNSIMAGRGFAGQENIFSEIIDLGLGPGAKDIISAMTFLAAGIERAATGRPGLDKRQRVRLSRQLMPVLLRRSLDAWKISQDKVVVQPTTGRPIFTPSNANKEAVLTLAGFRSTERAEREREVSTARRIGVQQAELRRGFIDRILAAMEKGDRDEAAQLRQEARRRGLAITNDAIIRARREREKTTFEKALEAIPKRKRREIEDRVRSRLELERQR